MTTKTAVKCLLLAVIAGCAPGPALADDLHGVDRILCSAVSATVCTVDGDCETDLPYNWNIPQFIEIDLARKTLSTTKASGENRSTPAASLARADARAARMPSFFSRDEPLGGEDWKNVYH